MTNFLQILHWAAGLIVLAEALNKLERTTPFAQGMTNHDRLVDGLKAIAWTLLALGSAVAVFSPAFGVNALASQMVLHQSPSMAEVIVLMGFAVLIIRTRVKEG